MIICKDVNNNKVIPGDRILYTKSDGLEKATVISIGRNHLIARKVSDSSMANIRIEEGVNKHIIRYDW